MLEAIELTCERDDRLLFEGLNIALEAGDLLRVVGPNGSGKTTLLRTLCGLIPLQSGHIRWQGISTEQDPQIIQRNVLYIGHRSAVKFGMTALENLRFLHGLHSDSDEHALWQALDRVGLKGFEEVDCRNLSAGQQRRVGLARLYLSEAPLWILDEIFTAIDIEGVSQFEQLLIERAQQGGIVVMTTHHAMAIEGLRTLSLGGRILGQ